MRVDSAENSDFSGVHLFFLQLKGAYMDVQRLDKFISSQLVDVSRKDARELIRRGEVRVNGAAAKSPEQKISPDDDVITLRGERIGYKRFLYIMLNKPAGVVCASRDGLSETVIELLPPELRRSGLFPAGRLDKDTVGFVLITDDGILAHRILSPKSHVPKKYFVRLRDELIPEAKKLFAEGIVIDGEEKCLPAELNVLTPRECELTLHEGKYHQIKRMFSALGNEVTYLKRTEIAGILLDSALMEGHARELSEAEFNKLSEAR